MVRLANLQDIDELIRLLRQIADWHHNGRPDLFKLGGQKYSHEELSDILQNKNRPIFVAEATKMIEGLDDSVKVADSAGLVGYCFCEIIAAAEHPVLYPHVTLYIDDFCVDEKCRNQGIGKKIFAHVREYAQQIGAYNIDLNVWAFNEGAVRFYEDCGFSIQRYRMELRDF